MIERLRLQKQYLEKADFDNDAWGYDTVPEGCDVTQNKSNTFSDEEWNAMISYMKKYNLTWNDIIGEYERVIKVLEAYHPELLEKETSIYNLKILIKRWPYEKIKLEDDFKEYLEKDYSSNTNAKESNGFFSKLFGLLAGLTPLTNLFWNLGIQKDIKQDKFDLLTQEEKAIYYYLKDKYSKDEAEKYYDSLKDEINQRQGLKDALDYVKNLSTEILFTNIDELKNFLVTTGVGLEDGVVSFGENLLNLIPGNGEINSALQYKQAFLTAMLTQEIDLEAIKKQYGENSEEYKLYKKLSELQPIYKKALALNYNVACEIGESAVPMLVGTIPHVGTALGLALDGLSEAGAVKSEAYSNGLTGLDAYLFMGLHGVTSAILTRELKAIPGLSKNTSITLKGIIKAAVVAGFTEVAESKMDLFITKALTGEDIELEEIFNIEQDAMTFVTAACTAFILNGGNAIKVKYLGLDLTITPEDIASCTDEDGNVDVDGLISALIGKKVELYDDNTPMSKKINDVRNIFMQATNTTLKKYNISQSEIEYILNNKIKIYTTDAEFEKAYLSRGGKGDPKNIGGFNDSSDGTVHLRKNSSRFIILHECLHSLGSVMRNEDEREINEAFTDYFTNKFSGEYAVDSYTENTKALEQIINLLEKTGHKGLAEDAYFNSNPRDFAYTVNKLAGDNKFYEKLAKAMWDAVHKKGREKVNAQTEVTILTNNFIDKVYKHYNTQIDSAVKSINNKYPGSGLNRLREYVQTGNSNVITRDGNARSIIEGIPIEILKDYLKTHK